MQKFPEVSDRMFEMGIPERDFLAQGRNSFSFSNDWLNWKGLFFPFRHADSLFHQ